jgi:hypothetical protein
MTAIDFWGPANGFSGQPFLSNPWDVVFFNGDPLPGKWSVQGLPTLAVDRKKHAGVDGAAITVNGYIPGPVELEGLLWTPDQWEFFQAKAPDIWRKPTKKAKLSDLAVTIDHPALALWGITKVVVVGVSPPSDGPIKFSKIVKIKCLEYVALDKTTRTKTAQTATRVEQTPQHVFRPAPDETDAGIHGAAPDTIGGAP